jgi:hypothetical protein
MQLSNYTSQNIARALGLTGFENDEDIAAAQVALRVLVLPSFHPELCLTFLKTPSGCTLSVISANEQIWQQAWPTPHRAETCVASGIVLAEALDGLITSARRADSTPNARVVVLDGMRVHTVLRVDRRREVDISENVGQRGAYGEFVAAALEIAWNAVSGPEVQNALRAAGSYVGSEIPEQSVPPKKPTVRTVVLGPEDVASQLLESLKRKHES